MRIRPLAAAVLLIALGVPLFAADKLRLNEATQEQLVALGLTQSQAMQVLSYRKENGDFLQIEELLAVPQISHETFDKVRDKVTVDE